MADFHLNAISAPAPAAYVRPIEHAKPPPVQPAHPPQTPVTSSRGPAVVLGGALAKGAEKYGQQSHSEPPPATGQHINHVI
jgi:hypothetical protein